MQNIQQYEVDVVFVPDALRGGATPLTGRRTSVVQRP
jgi:hypothetical protein